MSFYQTYNSLGSMTSFSSTSHRAEKINKHQTDLLQIYANIIHNRQCLYTIVGLDKFILCQNSLTTFANDMGAVERQFNMITSRKNKQIVNNLKWELSAYYDNILELKQLFLKKINLIRKNNLATPEIVKCVLIIEKYFAIKNDTELQDEEDFDRLDIPYELDL